MSSNPSRKREFWIKMFEESHRRNSFNEWEPSYHADPNLLAKHGFYHCGPGDRVQCVFCHNKLEKWDPGDCVESEHRRHYPHCPFVRELCGDLNVPISSNLEVQGRAHKDLTATEAANFSCRLKSMERCHSYGQEHLYNIACAGFYFSSHDERFHCFSCGLIMPGFEPGVDPWRVHALSLTDCAYLKQVKGADFVQQVQDENRQASPAANQPVPAETGPSSSTEISSEASDLRCEQYPHLVPTVERDMTSPSVKAVKELFHIPTAQIKERLLEIRIRNGTGYIVRSQDFNDLMLNCADHCDPASELIQSGREITLEMASNPLYAPYLNPVIDRDMTSPAVNAVMEYFHIPTARIRERLLEIRFIHGTGYIVRSQDFNDLMLNCADHCDPASELIQSGREITLEMASNPLYAPYLNPVIDRDMIGPTVNAVMEYFHIPTARIRERLLEIRFIHGTTYKLKSEDFKDLMFNCDDFPE